MKTICLAGKHDIAVNVLLYCLEHYEKKYIKCILNRNETGINSWQKSMKWFAEKKDVEIIELEDAYNIRGVIHRFFLFYTMRNIQALHCIRSGSELIQAK